MSTEPAQPQRGEMSVSERPPDLILRKPGSEHEPAQPHRSEHDERRKIQGYIPHKNE